ncbi:dnaJ homolog subfamily C member 11 [Leptopilina boulardi]|uniref:dnaJ homolog subfamily C member 11 n=1 Tax=Leptopilina boulardi TaxID=63433 RepID=UPI0021F54612|nr:dnaJ homolog subfamily C member 11 [Leptopilina boulardi]
MEDESEQDNVIEDDYYSFLNIPRNASDEDISSAYRRLSKLYHPDKHPNSNNKKEAEVLFNRTRKAYEVLSDPHKRAIYDSLGIKGLETEGWEIIQRTKTPQEIREEYERLARLEEECRLQQRTRPRGSITVNINASDVFNSYDESYGSGSLFSSVQVSGMTFTQSIEAPLTTKDTLIMYGELGVHNGNGSGTINVSAKRLVSEKGWVEIDVGAGNGLNVALKGFRTLSKRIFCNGEILTGFTSDLAKFGLAGSLAMQLDKYTIGYLTYKMHAQTGMSTIIERNTPNSYTAFTIHFGLLNSYINLSYTHKMPERQLQLKSTGRVGTFGGFIEYGAEKKVSSYTTLATAVRVGVPTGVSLRVRLSRGSQNYSFPIHLCDEILPAPVFYATVAPLITWTIVKKFVIDPILKEQKERNKEKQRKLNKSVMLEKQKEAKAAVELMKATFSRIRAEEEYKRGLVITKALYGRFVYPQDRNLEEEATIGQRDEVIDVTIPLQCLVSDSRLVLHQVTKSQLPGFYDPCVGEEKQLLVQYLFHAQSHECVIKDEDSLRIPKQSHRVNTT